MSRGAESQPTRTPSPLPQPQQQLQQLLLLSHTHTHAHNVLTSFLHTDPVFTQEDNDNDDVDNDIESMIFPLQFMLSGAIP